MDCHRCGGTVDWLTVADFLQPIQIFQSFPVSPKSFDCRHRWRKSTTWFHRKSSIDSFDTLITLVDWMYCDWIYCGHVDYGSAWPEIFKHFNSIKWVRSVCSFECVCGLTSLYPHVSSLTHFLVAFGRMPMNNSCSCTRAATKCNSIFSSTMANRLSPAK